MKVLLSAYYCLPSEGSESAIGWNWAREIAARGHQVFVITRAINRNAIEMARASDSTPNLQFLFHDLSPTIQAFFKFPFGSYVYYLLWQSAAANLAVQVHAKERFDMVQHITLATFRRKNALSDIGPAT